MNIQIVEDDLSLSEGVAITLSDGNSFHKEHLIKDAKTGFLNYGDELSLIILDLNLPDGSGYDYLKFVRERSNVPVLILTANDLEMDEVTGLTLGADDFLTKPFSLAVLRARVASLIRRSEIAKEASGKNEGADKTLLYELDDMTFDFDKLIFKKGKEELVLSVNEQRLLKIFLDNKGRVLTRNLLIDRLWGNDGAFVDENALSVTINRLRSKIDGGADVKHISTVYGQGYRFD
ncbi:MAG: response regulator transcription factor [Lachnospiraceae bacterium]|nr:response regulator transcription factor [Lachnospiraceae bacterium]